MDKKPNCKTGLKFGVINSEVFERETAMCRKLHNERNGKCCWGECEKCGVVPLLYKLHKGELLEDPEDVKKAKEDVFKG